MKRIWQLSTSLLFGAILATQVSAQGYGPRSWRAYTPATVADRMSVADGLEDQAEDAPTPVNEKRSAKPVAPKVGADVSGKKANDSATAAYFQADSNAAEKSAKSDVAPASALTAADPNCTTAPDCEGLMPAPACGNSGYGDPNCSDLASGCGDACCDAPTRNFARVEYLMWWGKGRSTPPLVTSSFNGTPMADAGVLGLASTTVLYGGNDIGTDHRSGARVTVGRVLDNDGAWMAVGRFYGLGDSSDEFNATSVAGDPILARPFFNTLLLQQDALLVGFPGVSENGSINVRGSSDMLGAEALVRYLWSAEEDTTIDFVGGYQFARLDDSLEIRNSSLVLLDPQGIFQPNTTINMRDSFRTRNEFHGGVIGMAIDNYRGPWKFEALGKVGFGNIRQTVTIDGNTVITPLMGAPVNSPQGLLARATNSGTFTRDQFTFIPEANFNLGYQYGNWTFLAGYSFIYYKHMAFAGDQIDTRVNLSNPLVGAPLPAQNFRQTDHWLQGVNFGLEYTF